ncbi:MAG: 16S rRNA (cytidine(1402)-2'-O)-methyltransferase [Pseudomonadales bacterium]
MDMPGVLYVVATPIGNLSDLSRRAAEVLGSVAMIAAEDTRRTRVLLDAIGANGQRQTLIALIAHNEARALTPVLQTLQSGANAALVSDAGTPLLSDPGFELVRACFDLGIQVLPVPGPSAIMAVLSVCPLPVNRFRFEGFLPARALSRRERLEELLAGPEASVVFEAPHRIAACLGDLEELIPDRAIMLGREMTKLHEQYLCGTPGELRRRLETGNQLRGEFVLVLPPTPEDASAPDVLRTMTILAREMSPAQAARIGAELLNANKRDLYALAMRLRGA